MTREDELKEVKELIKKYYENASLGMYFTKNKVGDLMKTIFKGEYFTLNICHYYEYYELFGCTDTEEDMITRYYDSLMEVDEMKFDKSKVYTALNADELKVGSKVIVRNTLDELRNVVEHGSIYSSTTILRGIKDGSYERRFSIGNETVSECWNLAYLMEEPPKLKWTDLKIGDIITDGDDLFSMVTQIDKYNDPHVYVGDTWLADSELTNWSKVE